MYSAFRIRYDYSFDNYIIHHLYWLIPLSAMIKLIVFYCFDLYKGMWRYTSIRDLFNILKASFLASLIIFAVVGFSVSFNGLSRGVFLIDYLFSVCLISGARLAIRLYFKSFVNCNKKQILTQIKKFFFYGKHYKNNKKILIIGAGDSGEKIYREIRENNNLHYNVIGFLDDNFSKIGRKIHGLPVLSTTEEVKAVVEQTETEEIIIALPSATSDQIRRIIGLCKETGVVYKILPGIGELIDGKVSLNLVRDVEYKDLLGRDAVELDNLSIGNYLESNIVMVTGAAGSIGSGLCRQICKFRPKVLILFERAESPLYDIDLDLKKGFPDIKIVPVLGDIQSKADLTKVFNIYRPEIVFHAAAYKHVPMLENYPWKAVYNNIFGTKNLVDFAEEYNCKKFVFVSTDKAVNPTNIMGTSKRISEMIVQNKNRKESCRTNFMTVRFGNVIGSAGSVIPLFKRQISDGGPVTVTHPEVIRYFMLIPEACQLILQAGAMGEGGEIFVLDMGKPVKIAEMAKDLIKFSGFEPDVDIKIEYIGLRPGEKLYEELLTDGEDIIPTSHKKIMVLKSRQCNLNELDEELCVVKKSADIQSIDEIKRVMHGIVPEYITPAFEYKN